MTLLKVQLEDQIGVLKSQGRMRARLGGPIAPFVLSGVLFDAGGGAGSPFMFGGVRVWKLGAMGGVYSRDGEARFGYELTFYNEW